jgi:hypothetical protein
MSLPNQRPNPLSDNELRQLYETGLTLRELADRFGQSDETIRRAMKTAGIPRRPRGQPVGKYLPNGGRTVDKSGYVLIRMPDHPRANHAGYVREHRLVMEKLVGRYLRPEEVVHHRNGVKDDNRPENLKLYATNGKHKEEDMLGNQWAKGDFGNPKRKVRVFRTPDEILEAIRTLAASLDRPIRRTDLRPPYPSYRTVTRAFGGWREGVAMALDDEFRETVEGGHVPGDQEAA